MNNSVKFTIDSLRFTVFSLLSTDSAELKASKEASRLRFKDGWRRVGRCAILLAVMLLGGMTAKAADYVISYTSDGQVYYIGMNSSNQLIATKTFDMSCIWTCINRNNTTENTLATNDRRRLRNKKYTSYYLYASVTRGGSWQSGYTYTWAISASTTASTYWYGSNGTSLYHYDNSYNQGNGYLHNSGSTITISTSTSNAFIPYQVSTNSISAGTKRIISSLSIDPSSTSLYYNESQSFTTSTSVIDRVVPAHTTYTFNNITYYYYNSTFYSSVDEFLGSSTTVTPTVTYSWTKSGDGNTNVSLSSTTAAATTATHSTAVASDKTVTLTVTASTTGAESQSALVTVYLLATNPAAPVIARYGNSQAQITCEAIGATIYYTTDGSDPSTSSTEYTGPFDIDCPTTTVKAIAHRNNHSSTPASETLTCKLPTPVISLSDAVATVTAGEGTPEGTKLYYTTDGTTPTSSSSPIASGNTVTLTNTQTLKVIAIKTGYDNSDIASAEYIVEGVNDGLVVLDDREDHTWSYYQASGDLPTGYPSELHSPDPRNVKITYKGNGQYTNGNAVSGVKVGVDANDSTFIYYKTLEKGGDSKYAYTTIPNPFSVRPKSGSTYYGFSHWKVTSISGGTIDGYALNSSINAETEIKFVPSGTYTTNCTSMEVVLEAVWDVAEVSTSGTFTNNYGVERMFYVVAGGNTNLASANKACTYSSFYPNGTTNGTDAATLSNRVTRYAGFSATYDSKIEYIILRNYTSTLNANGKNFTIGRGVSAYSDTCATNLYGLSNNQSTGFKFRIESGTYSNLFFMGSERALTAGVMTATMGCDYDRALKDNTKLKVSKDITVAYSATLGSIDNKGAEIFNCTVKSGNYDLGESMYAGSNQFYLSNWGSDNYIYGKRKMTVEGGIFSDIAGGMDDDGTTTQTMVEIRIKGGTMNSVVYGAAQKSDAQGHRIMVITGGDFKGWIAGGANGNATGSNYNGELTGNTYIYVGGNANVNSNGSTSPLNRALGGNVFGAGCGYGSNYSSGLVTGNTNVVIADNAYIERGVYGGGSYGYTTQTSNIYILGGTIDGRDGGVDGTSYLAAIDGGVYGGACQNQGGTVNIIMNGGTVNGSVYGGSNYTGNLSGSSTVTLNGGTINGSLYGGGNGEGSASTNVSGAVQVTVNGGTVTGAVYGCNNNQGAPQSTVNVDIYGTDPAPSADSYAIGKVFGGGNQANYGSKPVVTVHNCDNSIGEVYGGGNAARVANTEVHIYGGNRIGEVYAGGNGEGVAANFVMCTTAVANIYGGTIGRVFAGNNSSGTISNGATVNIECSTEGGHSHCPMQVGAVFHGGNQAASAQQTVNIVCTGDATEGIDTLFGGANAANITGGVTLNVTKGNIRHAIFGGNNADNSINGDIAITLGTDASCQFPFPTVFGGGYGANTSATGDVTVTVGDKAGTMQPTVHGDIYGGSALGSVNDAAADKTTVNIYNGTVVGRVFGGGLGDANNASRGQVNGVVTVNIGASDQEDANCHSDLSACSVYGCNNTNGSPQQNVTVNIYKTGHTAKNAASYHTAADSTFAIDQVFGGGNAADFTPTGKTATVHVYGCNNTVRRLFGGGDAAAAVGVETTIEGGRFGWVFGGGNGEYTAANIGAGGTNLTIQAGRIEHLFGGSNERGTLSGTMTTNINHDNSGCEEYIREFFGGANLAPINTDLSTTIACGTTFDKVYGGSKKAAITGNVTMTVNGGTINEVYGGSEGTNETAANITGNVILNIYGGAIGKAFGGSNINGNITGTITTNLDWSQSDCEDKSIDYIYGASNLATYNPSAPKPDYSPVVNLINGTVEHKVFGSGRGSDDEQTAGKVTANPKVVMSGSSAWVKENIYGGGEMASVDGNTTVNISNGAVGLANLDPADINGHGNVFGGGLGKAGSDYSTFAYVTNAYVNLTGGTVRGSVFGGGENGHVSANTYVTIGGGVVGVRLPHHLRNISSDAGSSNPVYAGNVYGGGRGVDHTAVGDHLSETAGRVYGNTSVSVSGGQIHHSVYGGGSLASVGTYTLTEDATIYGGYIHNFTENTGNATVAISGGRIGPTWDELLLDHAGTLLVDANGDPKDDASYTPGHAADTIAKNYECLGENEGMVYGSGRGVNYPNDDNQDHKLYVEMAFTNNTTVTISGTAMVIGSVFGGGENGHVKGNTQVNIQGGTIGGIPLHHNGFDLPGHTSGHGHVDDENTGDDELGFNNTGIGRSVFRGNVYGGGRGIDHTTGDATTSSQHIFSVSAGRVYGNTEVNVTGGHILHNVFGGGSIASVGTYSYPSDGEGGYNFFTNPSAVVGSTGKTTVNISGGQVGVMGENEGYVYGGGRGIAGTNETQVSHLAFVNETEVNISQTNSTHADVRASVFGGGMNGHVLTNTQVNVSGGVVGGKTADNYGSGAESYDPTNFASVPGTVDLTLHGVSYYSGIRGADTITRRNGTGPATVFLGNVYGGGRGVDVTSGSNLSYTAGRVYGNTEVNITGGVIYHSVFGGGSIASVGTFTTYTAAEAAADSVAGYRILEHQPKTCAAGTGNAVVTITGGRIGTNGRNNGRVFGSSRGMAGTNYRGLGYVNRAHVIIGEAGGNTSTPLIRGSVFGSGENGHVLDSTLVEVKSGHIGNGKRTGESAWLNAYIGNVYGGGRGLDRDISDGTTISPFAGRVYRTSNVVVTGGQIDHSVYGGGSLASVGRFKRNNSNVVTYSDPNKGLCRVTVSGGTIGIDGDRNGHVFGSSRGTATANNNVQSSLAYVTDTRVDIQTGATIKGSVFGGGESGHVNNNTLVTVSGGTIGGLLTKAYNSYTAAEQEVLDLQGNVYGGGRGIDTFMTSNSVAAYSMSAGYVRGTTRVVITGSPSIRRNVYGGGSMGLVGDYGSHGYSDFWEGSDTNGTATVIIKGTVGHATNVGYGYGGNVYGSSRGQANDPTHDAKFNDFFANGGFGEMAYVYKTHVIVETGANVLGNVYGGGENGHVDFGGTTVDILNGTVAGNVFGGGKGTSTSPTAGIIDGPTVVNIGSVSQTSEIDEYGSHNTVVIGGDVFAGNDSYSSPLGTMTVNVYHTKHTATNKYPTLSNPVVASDTAGNSTASKYALRGVYGGGNLADVLTGIAAVDASDGNASHVYDQRYITQRIEQSDNKVPNTMKPWPGGISRKSEVNIYNCDENTIQYVFGGGRAAKTIEDEVNIYGGRIYQAYAGGDGSSAPAYVGYVDGSGSLRTITGNSNHGNATINVTGGIVHQVFGGCNTQGEVYGVSDVEFEEGGDCDIVNSEVFGGNNRADMHGNKVVTIKCGTKWNDVYGGANQAPITGNVTLNIVGGKMKRAFGGSKAAPITGDVTVNVYGGTIGELYGGNNISGNITGQITVNIDWTTENTCADAKSINYVYGGGNLASYTPTYSSLLSPRVNIIKGTVDTAVFGGGYGTTAVVNANPWVVVGADRVKNMAGSAITPVSNLAVAIGSEKNPLGRTLMGDIFGGGNAAMVVGDPYVVIKGTRTKVRNNVYGGGNAATVVGSTDIQVGYDADIMPPVLTLNGSGQMVITSTTAGANIKYTTDGTDPTATTGSDYSSALTLSDGQVIKAVAVKNGKTSAVAYNTVATPTIDIDGNGVATVSCSTPGVTLRYISGASPADPTASTGTVYDPENKPTVTEGHTIKVLAVRNGFANSAIGSATR